MTLLNSPEYQLAQRVLKAWEACPVDDNGFGETVILARAYLAMVAMYEEKPAAWIVQADHPWVTMLPPVDGGLPRTPLYRRSTGDNSEG